MATSEDRIALLEQQVRDLQHQLNVCELRTARLDGGKVYQGELAKGVRAARSPAPDADELTNKERPT